MGQYSKSIYNKLQIVAENCNGIFFGQIFNNRNEKDSLKNIRRKYPHFFKVLYNSKSNLYQLTNDYYYHFNIKKKISLRSNVSSQIIWTAFFLDTRPDIDNPKGIFQYNDIFCKLDLFEDNDLKKISKDIVIITSPHRKNFFNSRGNKIIFGRSFLKKWVQFSFNEYIINKNKNDLSDDFYIGMYLNNSIIPNSESECHQDKREYPGLKEKVSGIEKWDLDQWYMNKKKELPPQYKLGVYI